MTNRPARGKEVVDQTGRRIDEQGLGVTQRLRFGLCLGGGLQCARGSGVLRNDARSSSLRVSGRFPIGFGARRRLPVGVL